MSNVPTMQMGIKGYCRFILRQRDLSVIYDTGWFPNIITNAGMVNIRDLGGGHNYSELGSDNTAPAITDTDVIASLGARKAGSGITTDYVAASPDYIYSRIGYRYEAGHATGNVREICTYRNSAGDDANTRNLVIDTGGNPVTIVKGAENILDTYHEYRNYGPTGDATGSIDVSGTTYNYIARACQFYDGTPEIRWTGATARESLASFGDYHYGCTGDLVAYDSASLPVGNIKRSGSGNALSIQATGDYYNDVQIQAGIDAWNITIRTVVINTGNCLWQIQYDKAVGGGGIVKTDEDRLRLNYRLSWVRL
jgi:hypothetical protein